MSGVGEDALKMMRKAMAMTVAGTCDSRLMRTRRFTICVRQQHPGRPCLVGVRPPRLGAEEADPDPDRDDHVGEHDARQPHNDRCAQLHDRALTRLDARHLEDAVEVPQEAGDDARADQARADEALGQRPHHRLTTSTATMRQSRPSSRQARYVKKPWTMLLASPSNAGYQQ